MLLANFCFIEAGGYRDEQFWEGERARRWLKGEDVAGGQNTAYLRIWEFTHRENWKERITWVETPQAMQAYEAISRMEKEELLQILNQGMAKKSRQQPDTWEREGWNEPNQPVTGVTWFEARAYCAWISQMIEKELRLPDEFEWEAAARGLEANSYPWGPEWDAGKANTIEERVLRPSPVGAYAAVGGLGPDGVEEQSGNVLEWTASRYSEDYLEPGLNPPGPDEEGERVARGGSWRSLLRDARCAYRLKLVPDNFDDKFGFRLFSPGLFLDSDG